MSNNHTQFEGYLSKIALEGEDLTKLRTSRNANRDRITNHWQKVLNRTVPDFEEQGSFAMGLIIRPIEGDYDLDDGMYLKCIGSDPANWPATTTVQGWIVKAVEGATRDDPKCMKRCVRIPYKDGYHIDIPSYGIDQTGKTRVFKKNQDPKDFDESNPVDLVSWFEGRKALFATLPDVIRFFKGWRDFKGGALLKLKSVAVTILISEKIVSNARYDLAVRDTALACEAYLRGGGDICKPVAPGDDLTSHWTSQDRADISDAFKSLAEQAQKAIDAEKIREGALIWQGQFGTRFPVPEDENEKLAAPSIFVKRDVSESQPFS